MSSWKDTVMSDDKVKEELNKYFTEEQMLMPEEIHTIVCGVIAVVRKAQAEITWDKAIREVVEWIEKHTHKMNTNMYGISLGRAEWQAKLKEWNK